MELLINLLQLEDTKPQLSFPVNYFYLNRASVITRTSLLVVKMWYYTITIFRCVKQSDNSRHHSWENKLKFMCNFLCLNIRMLTVYQFLAVKTVEVICFTPYIDRSYQQATYCPMHIISCHFVSFNYFKYSSTRLQILDPLSNLNPNFLKKESTR